MDGRLLLEDTNPRTPDGAGADDVAAEAIPRAAIVAVVSNPRSNRNKTQRGRVRRYCDGRPEIVHFELSRPGDLDRALDRIAASRVRVIAVNGGDGTVQAVLNRVHGADAPKRALPPIAVLPSGRTNLIAKDLGAMGDPIAALERLIETARAGLKPQLVERQLIALDAGDGEAPKLGMFLAAGALAEIMLYCRHRIYPLNLPNWLAHLITVVAGLISVVTDSRAGWLPPSPRQSVVSIGRREMHGRFQVLMVSTLHALVLTGRLKPPRDGTLGLVAMERRRMTAVRAVIAAFIGRIGTVDIPGLHFEAGDEIHLGREHSAVIMDGETFEAAPGQGIVLRPAPSVAFVHLGAPALETAGEETSLATPAAPQLAALTPLWNSRSRP